MSMREHLANYIVISIEITDKKGPMNSEEFSRYKIMLIDMEILLYG